MILAKLIKRLDLLEEVVEEARQRMLGNSPAIKALRDKANKALASGDGGPFWRSVAAPAITEGEEPTECIHGVAIDGQCDCCEAKGIVMALGRRIAMEPYENSAISVYEIRQILKHGILHMEPVAPDTLERVADAIHRAYHDEECLVMGTGFVDRDREPWARMAAKAVIAIAPLPEPIAAGEELRDIDHLLKVWPEYFPALESGAKTFELRKNDRFFKVGDILQLQEWSPGTSRFTGKSVTKRVTYILHHAPQFGLMDDYCILSLADVTAPIAAGGGELPENWLSTELCEIDNDVAKWPKGIKESFDTLIPSPSDSDTVAISASRHADLNCEPSGCGPADAIAADSNVQNGLKPQPAPAITDGEKDGPDVPDMRSEPMRVPDAGADSGRMAEAVAAPAITEGERQRKLRERLASPVDEHGNTGVIVAPLPEPIAAGEECCGHYFAQDGICIYCHAEKTPAIPPSPSDSDLVERWERVSCKDHDMSVASQSAGDDMMVALQRLEAELRDEKQAHMRTAMGLHECDEELTALQAERDQLRSALKTIRGSLEGQRSAVAATILAWCDHALTQRK